MEKYGYIPKIEEGVVIGNSHYGGDVWRLYRKFFTETDWLMRMETKRNDEISSLDFNLFIGRPTMMNDTEVFEHFIDGPTVMTSSRYKVTDLDIGADTIRIFCGSAKSWRTNGESAALYTGTGDRYFGNLMILTCKGENTPAGFILMGSIDETLTTGSSLFRHMLSCFDGQKLSKKEYLQKISPSNRANIALLSNEERHAENHAHQHRSPSRDEFER